MNEHFATVSWPALAGLMSAIFMIGTALATIIIWINREFFGVRDEVHREMANVKTDLNELRVEVAREYVKLKDLDQVESRLENALTKIGDRLDRSIENLLDLLRKEAISGRARDS